MMFSNDYYQSKRKKEYLNEYEVFIDDSGTYPTVHLHLGKFFEERGHPYNVISIMTYLDKYDVVKALKDFRVGAAYFFEGLMQMAELTYRDGDELKKLLKFEHLCSLHEEDMQRVLEAYKTARMELVRDLVRKRCE